ncbi:MAG TPA: DUF5916 domain-containing protein [Longimicrobiales bacterium]
MLHQRRLFRHRAHTAPAVVAASLITAALAFTPAHALAQTLASANQVAAIPVSRALDIQRATSEIRLDGRLDEPAWLNARRISDFREFQPGHMTEPSVRTEALVTHDDENLYVAIIAYDDPTQVRATLTERDAMFADDWAGLLLDTWGDQQWGYLIIANPYGVQGDTRLSNNGDDDRFDVVFDADGAITDDGYVVEIAVPFSSLRFRGDTEDWRIGFIRNHPRDARRMYSWPALDNNNGCLLCQFSEMETLPGVRSGGGLELLPSVVASQAGGLPDGDPAADFDNADPSASFSLGARMPFGDGWNAELTYNPDFSQVESDAAQVDVNTTFALSFPERRPFFQDGADLFETRLPIVYTRSINNPEFAGKLTGAIGNTSIAVLSAYDEDTPIILPFAERSGFVQGGESWSNIVRARHSIGSSGSAVGVLLTDRRLIDGGAGSTASIDGLWRFADVYYAGGQITGSYTQEPNDPSLTEDVNGVTFDGHTADFDGERFTGHGIGAAVGRSTRYWSWDVSYTEASPTARADNGFVAQNGYRNLGVWTDYTFHPERHGIIDISPEIGGGSVWNWDGTSRDVWINPGIWASITRQTQLGVNHVHTFSELFNSVRFDNYGRTNFWLSSNFSERVTGGFEVGYGESIYRPGEPPVLGNGTYASLYATVKPIDRLTIEPSISYQDLSTLDDEELYAGYVARTRFQLQFTRELSLRLVTQYVDFGDAQVSVEPLVMYRLNPFSIFYVGMTDRYMDFGDEFGYAETDRQFFVKLQYLLRT